MRDLTGFQRDALYVISGLEAPKGTRGTRLVLRIFSSIRSRVSTIWKTHILEFYGS